MIMMFCCDFIWQFTNFYAHFCFIWPDLNGCWPPLQFIIFWMWIWISEGASYIKRSMLTKEDDSTMSRHNALNILIRSMYINKINLVFPRYWNKLTDLNKKQFYLIKIENLEYSMVELNIDQPFQFLYLENLKFIAILSN